MTKHSLLIATALTVLLVGVVVFGRDRFYKPGWPQKFGYSSDLNDLRVKFNADKGKVRLLMLLSPS